MKILRETLMLPFSFCRYDENHPEEFFIKINRKSKWITFARIPIGYNFKDFLTNHVYSIKDNLLIDGCNDGLAFELVDHGFEPIKVGQEAFFNLSYDHFNRKSIKELIRRGFRNRVFEEIGFSEKTKIELERFRKDCTHGNEPQLKYLFNTVFEPFFRLFVLKDENQKWLGAIMISIKENNFAQTELILRKKHAPVGVMEALIYSVFNQLKAEGFLYWSLGAVPFTVYEDTLFSKEGLLNFIGRRLRFAYNYEGLFFFKNKFNPIWIDYYFCIKPRLTFMLLFKILIKTNLLALIIFKIRQIFQLKNIQ